ncbi:MAG TPA: serine--tRNA ligase, partial [Clostridiaceae bacterium]|nr:serine--tRNA ligase [Clostridiaceae bacterium]
MLDLKRIRTDLQGVKDAMKIRGEDFDLSLLDKVVELDEKRRKMITEAETLKSKRNSDSQKIAKLKKKGDSAEELLAELKQLSDKVKEYDDKVANLDSEIYELMLTIPNIPNPTVPVGKSDADNLELRKWGTPRKFGFDAKAHWDIGVDLDILDFEDAAKVTGSRFTFYKGAGARLERACINFMLDLHTTKHGYKEIFPPYMVHRRSMIGTGQLPKFEEDAFKVAGTDYFLIPTAE